MTITGSTKATPITKLRELKDASKTVRTGTDAQVDALYSRVLSTMSWYYTQFNASDKHEFATKRNWKEAMLQLSGKGTADPQMFANMLLKMTRRLLANPRTEHRGRNLLVELAGNSGHLGMNLLDLYKDLAKRFKLKLTVGPGVSQYEGDATVRPLTFVLSANNDGGLTIRLMQAGGAHDPSDYPLYYGPWDPPDNTHQYTEDDVDGMTRAQFDDRRRLHQFYRNMDEGEYESGLDWRRDQLRRQGRGFEALRDYDPVAVGTVPSDPPGLTQPVQWGYTVGNDGQTTQHLDRHLGDHIFPVATGTVPELWYAAHNPDLMRAYHDFHDAQLERLTELGRQRQARMRGMTIANAALRPQFHGPVHDAQRRRCEPAQTTEQAGDGKRKREEGVRKSKDKPSAKKAVTDENNPTVMQNPAAQLGPAWAGATPPLTRALPVTQERVQARTVDDRFDACVTGAVRALDDAQQGSGLYHHIGASSEQQIIAGTGLIPAPPGFHMMSTGQIMPDAQVGAGLGALLKNDPDRPGLNPRPYNYLGPGNPLDGKPPHNAVDAIALEHDRAYAAATSYKDIDSADRAFVRQMNAQPGLVAPVASLAIGAKNRLERAVGPIYPSASALNRARECQQNAPTAGFPM